MRGAVAPALLAAALAAGPATAQTHGGHAMPGMAMPGMAATPAPAIAPAARAADPACPPEHAAMGHCTPAGPAAAPSPPPRTGTDLPAGDAPPPPAPATPAAARIWGAAAMAAADRRMRAEHGGMTFGRVLFNLAEVQPQRGRDGYRWDGEGRFGGDIHRLVVRSQGEGTFGERSDRAEVQALYSRTIGPYFDVQAGLRQDVGRGGRTHAALGVEGLAPYWFDVEAMLFLSDRGDVLARIEGFHDQRITQRLILQPRVEANLAAQDVADSRIAAGLSDIELGLRLRYELRREFAPYAGLSWERRYGPARIAGPDRGGAALVVGIRGWF